MATCSLRFYEKSKLKPENNWCFDDIETYLATLTYNDVSSFQYQRFELEKEIRVDLNQVEQTIASSAKKYDYLRISTTINNTPIYYYYFITKTRQVSEETIAYALRMDTLNTFKYDSTPANNKYTLSKKTLIKREHKDRMHKIGGSDYYIATEIQNKYNFNAFKNGKPPYPVNESLSFLLNLADINIAQPTWFYFTNYSHAISVSVYKNGVLQNTFNSLSGNDSIYIDPSGLVKFYDYVNMNSGASLFYLQDYDWNICQLQITLDRNWQTWGIYCRPDELLAETFGERIIPYTMQNRKNMYVRDIDEYQEGLSTILFKKKETTLYDEDRGRQWYVVYASANAVQSADNDYSAAYVNPVQVRFYSDDGYSISTKASHEVKLYATSSIIPKWKRTAEYLKFSISPAPSAGQKYIKISGTTYDFHDYDNLTIKRTNNTDVNFSAISIIRRADSEILEFSNIESVIFYGINTLSCVDDWHRKDTEIFIGSGTGTYSGSCDSWQGVDLSDSRLIKAFAFPYAPCEFLVGKTSFSSLPDGVIFSTDNVIELNVQQTPIFSYTKVFNVENPQIGLLVGEATIAAGVTKNIKFESKLFHSDYYQPKFVYDSFAFPFYLENIKVDEYISDPTFLSFSVNYVVSQNIQSKFMFAFPQYVLKKSTQDYDNVLCVERNNEKALFTNAYINYIKAGGYTYDTKKASSQNAVNGITTALSIVGSIASFASSGATGAMGIAGGLGLAIGATTGIIRSVHTAQEQDRGIAQKIMQSQMQGTSVQGSEDIDILTAFSGNKAKVVYYELSDIMKNAMYDLFYYCGYATHEQKKPVITGRLYFNFIQAEIIFESYNFNEEIADDIQNKWNEGITFFHAVSGDYDIQQQYENFETSLM